MGVKCPSIVFLHIYQVINITDLPLNPIELPFAKLSLFVVVVFFFFPEAAEDETPTERQDDTPTERHGLADVMAKILHRNVPVHKQVCSLYCYMISQI